MLLDLESLRCFIAGAKHLNFRKAAREVALSPAAFSERVKRLELELDVALFVRRPREITLSSAGSRLLPQALRTLEECTRCRDAVHPAAPRQLALTIGTRFELGLSWLTPALSTLQQAHPARTLHLSFGDSPDLLQRVRNSEIDAAITSARFATAGYRYITLHDEDYVFVAAPSLLRRRPITRPPDLARHTLLDLGRDLPLFRYLRDVHGRLGLDIERHEYLGTIAAVRLRAVEGVGVAVLPRYFVIDDIARGRLRELLPHLRLGRDAFRLVWRISHPYPDALDELAHELQAIPLR